MSAVPDQQESSGRNQGNRQGNSSKNKKSGKSKFTGETPDMNAFYSSNMNGNTTFTQTTKIIELYIGRTCTRASDLLQCMKSPDLPNLPNLVTPPAPVPDGNNQVNPIQLFQWQQDMKTNQRKTEDREDYCQKAFSVIYGQCTPDLQEQVQRHEHWNEANNNTSPMALLRIIRSCSTGSGDSTTRDQADLTTEAVMQLLSLTQRNRQTNDEFFQIFTERVAHVRETIPMFGACPARVNQILNDDANMDPNDANDRIAATLRSSDEFFAALYVKNTKRKGTLVPALRNAHLAQRNLARQEGRHPKKSWPTSLDAASQFVLTYQHPHTGVAHREDDNGFTFANEGGNNDRDT